MIEQREGRKPALTQQTICIEVVTQSDINETAETMNPLVSAGQQLGVVSLETCRISQLYYLQGEIDDTAITTLAESILADPVTESWHLHDLQSAGSTASGTHFVEVSLLPGVTDSAATNLVRAAHELGIAGLERAATGQRYDLTGDLSSGQLELLASGLFANPVIQRYAIDTAAVAAVSPLSGGRRHG
ncbi:MAG: phosphoribosylformylglycinamidine synthase subunit PurS [Chloroflexota bacterium]